MVGLPDGKNFEDMYNRLGTIPACDRRTDGQTDILPQHSPRYAYASRGKNVLTETKRSINGHSEPILNAIVNVI